MLFWWMVAKSLCAQIATQTLQSSAYSRRGRVRFYLSKARHLFNAFIRRHELGIREVRDVLVFQDITVQWERQTNVTWVILAVLEGKIWHSIRTLRSSGRRLSQEPYLMVYRGDYLYRTVGKLFWAELFIIRIRVLNI